VSLPRRISGQVILVMSGRGRMMYQCLQPEPEGAILPKRSAPQEVNSSPHDAGASMANWLETNIQGDGVAPTPSPQNRTCSRVGGWRGTSCAGVRKPLWVTGCALFPPPPSKLLVSLSISSSFPVVSTLNSRSRMTPEAVSAFRISRTLTSGSSDHLSPFAMWWALPTADYYGDSVTMGLAPGRPSRVPLVVNVSSVT